MKRRGFLKVLAAAIAAPTAAAKGEITPAETPEIGSVQFIEKTFTISEPVMEERRRALAIFYGTPFPRASLDMELKLEEIKSTLLREQLDALYEKNKS